MPFAGWVVGTLRFDPHHPRRLWAALWGVWGSGLVAVSDDLGMTWRERRGRAPESPSTDSSTVLPAEPVYDLVPDPTEPDVVYAGGRSGVWWTQDGGRSWRHLTASYPEIHHVSSLLILPADSSSRTLLAGTWRRAYRSDDGGSTWRGVFTGMQLDSEVFQLRPVPGQTSELWASTCGWVYRSENLGESWTRFQDGLPERRTPAFAVLEDGRLAAGTIAGLYLSEDGGHHWRRRTDPELSIRAIAYDPRRPERVLLGTEGAGVWRSEDGGKVFELSSQGMAAVRVAAVLADETADGAEVLAAVHHAGPLSGIHRSTDGGRTFRPMSSELPPVLAFADAGERLYAATEAGLFERSVTSWRLVAELGQRRVEEVTAIDGRVTARTPDGSFERDAETLRFQPGVEGKARRDTTRSDSTRGEELLRVLRTGHGKWPVLVVSGRQAQLADLDAAEDRAEGPTLALDFPARDVIAAAAIGDRLLLGTTGHGLVLVDVPSEVRAFPAARRADPGPSTLGH